LNIDEHHCGILSTLFKQDLVVKKCSPSVPKRAAGMEKYSAFILIKRKIDKFQVTGIKKS